MSAPHPATQTARPTTRARQSAARDREYVRGFERGVAVIKAFTARTPALTVTQVAHCAGLTRAVARRYLMTLEVLGYVRREGSLHFLTPRVLELGFSYLSTITVADVARPFMIRIVAALNESCSVTVLDRRDVLYVARVNADRIMTTNLNVGSRLPAHATAMGKVLLANLPAPSLDTYFTTGQLRPLTARTIQEEATLRKTLDEVRRRGWATNDEESEEGVRTVAVPLFDRSGTVVAAMNLAAPASRVSMRELRRSHLPVLLEAAREISESLGAPRRTRSSG